MFTRLGERNHLQKEKEKYNIFTKEKSKFTKEAVKKLTILYMIANDKTKVN